MMIMHCKTTSNKMFSADEFSLHSRGVKLKYTVGLTLKLEQGRGPTYNFLIWSQNKVFFNIEYGASNTLSLNNI